MSSNIFTDVVHLLLCSDFVTGQAIQRFSKSSYFYLFHIRFLEQGTLKKQQRRISISALIAGVHSIMVHENIFNTVPVD